MTNWKCPFERIRDYPDCFQDCPDIGECKMKDSWKQIRPLPKLKDTRIKIWKITLKHCCATCDNSRYEGVFECALDPENITWDSGEIEAVYSTVCSHWAKIRS